MHLWETNVPDSKLAASTHLAQHLCTKLLMHIHIAFAITLLYLPTNEVIVTIAAIYINE
jgi:hypothetical protein